ncbi:Ig-like domain-containing protein [Paenibacillus sp. 1P07SE]|uniref:Ig-like domain-containing protein n=1 Tax=Paenibacillus sp. 1P07SE TaxID=3132209 RepID=UPI0039A618A1
MDWTGLTEAFATSASGTTIRLGDNIIQSSGSLAVPTGSDLTLDLAGYTLSIASSAYGAPAIRVDAGTSLTIEDSSPNGSGALTARSLSNSSAPGIGAGPRGSTGTITINGGTVTASGDVYSAGIGGGNETVVGAITINGGTITANGNTGGAGIGGGMLGDGGTITINGGTITANGGPGGAGIGGGIQRGSGNITINDGTVYATGNNGGTGIGVGYEGSGGTIVVQGGTITPATGVAYSISVIGTGQSGGDSSVFLTNNGTINIPRNYRLIIPQGLVVHNSGTISGEGRIAGGGTLNNSGTITVPVDGPQVEGSAFELRFHLNGGSGSISPVTLYAATLQQAGRSLPEPVRHGYAFAGWYTQLEDGVEVTDTYVFGSDLDVYARWTDATPPTVTLSSPAANRVNSPFTVTATFSEAVTGFTVGDVSVLNGSVSSLMTSDNVTYTFTVTPAAEGLVTVTVPAGGVNDAAGNGNEASAPLTRMYDGTAPTVTLSSTSVDPLNGAFTVTATFSKAVTGFTVADVAVLNGSVSSLMTSDNVTYTFTVTPAADGLVTVSIPAGAANDAAGNGNEASAPLTRMYDGTAPTVTLSSTAVDPVNGAFTATATFSEAVVGFGVEDVTVTGGEAGSWNAVDAATYTFEVTPTADGLVTVSIPAGVANDAAGNGNEASVPLTRTYDGTAPTVTLSSTAVDPVNGAFTATATFSEAVVGFGVEDVTVTGGEAGSWNAVDAATYTFEVTPTANGLVTVSIPAGAANDAAGNGNEASAPLTRTYDGTTPTVTLSSTSVDPLNGAFTVTATFSEAVTGFAASDVTVVNGIAGSWSADDEVTYTFEVTPTANGLVTVTIPAGVVNDAAGNGNEASAPLTRMYDGTTPTVALSSTSADPLNGAFSVTATFSEAVTGFAASDVTVVNGEAGSLNADDAFTYTFEVTPTADGLITVSIPAGAANDAAGNGNEASAPLTRMYDGTAPTVTLSSTSVDPVNGAFTVTATFSEAVTGFAASNVTVVNGEAGSLNADDAFTYTFEVTPTADGLVTVSILAGAANDAADNGNEASAPLTRTYDGTEPTVTLSSTSVDPLNGAFTVTATFSEAVTGFAASDATVVNGEAGSLNADDAFTYTFEVTPTANGLVTVTIPAGVVNDAAGNGNEASAPLTRMYDGTAPILAIDSPGSSEPAQSFQPVVTVTDASELTVLRYAWSSTSTAPAAEDAAWQTFTSGQALVWNEGDGDRYLHIYARDAAGNEQSASFGPYVLDNTEPVLELIGDDPYELPAGQPYVEPGARATDNIDGAIDTSAILISGEVDTTRPSSYDVHYTVSDRAGNTATATRSVHVYDGDPPVITLLGADPLVIAVDSSYEEPGATAYDEQDGDLTADIIVTGSVDTQEVGTYTRLYNVSDRAGNAAAEVSRTVHVIAPPVLELIGPAEMSLVQGGTFNDPGATATDAYYGSLSEQITVSGSVDTRTPGVYTLRYTVDNPIGQTAAAVRTVTVTQAPAPGGPNNGWWYWEPEDGDDTDPDGTTDDEPDNMVELVLNGRTVSVDAVKESTGDGRTVVRLRLTAAQVADLFAARVDEPARAASRGEVALLSLSVQAAASSAIPAEAVVAIDGIGDVVVLELPASALQDVSRTWPSARLRLIVDGHGLLLPLEAVEQVSADAVVALTIGRVSSADRDAAARAIAGMEAEALLAHPVAFALTADGRPVVGWDGAYRERTMTLPAPAGAEQATAVWIDGRGGLHFVPSVFGSGGRTITMPTRQDGAYTVIRSARSFADLAGHWAQQEIEQMANKQIVSGREPGMFAPSESVTRAEFAALLVRGLGLPERASTLSFTDVAATDWYAGAVATASEAGLVHGYEDGTFRPQARITREQMAVMIGRAMAYAGQAPGGSAGETSGAGTFADEAEIAEWAKEAVTQLTGMGIIQGVTATTFAPQAEASRAQSVVMLKRLLQDLGFVNLNI